MIENNAINKTKKQETEFEYINFTIEKESWNRYKLEDGTILKSKFVLINIIAKKGIEEKLKKAKTEKVNIPLDLSLQPSNVVGVEVSPVLIGEPSTEICPISSLKDYIVAADLDFETISETWNQYLLSFPKSNQTINLRVKSSPTKISRTSKFDRFGFPIYLADFTAEMKISPNPK